MKVIGTGGGGRGGEGVEGCCFPCSKQPHVIPLNEGGTRLGGTKVVCSWDEKVKNRKCSSLLPHLA